MVHNPLHCFSLHSRLHRQQYSPDSKLLQADFPPYPPSDIQVWTDGSVPSLFGPGGAGVYATCSKCNTSHSLSFSSGPIASSFTAETFALKQGLAWCTSHLMTCKFQSVLFPYRLSIIPLYPFFSPLLSPAWVPMECLVPCLLPLQQYHFELPMGPRTRRSPRKWKGWFARRNWCLSALWCNSGPSPPSYCQSPLFPIPQLETSHLPLSSELPSPEVSSEGLLLSRSIRSGLSRLRCHGHGLLLSSYLHRISRKENSDCSACGHPLQDLNHLLLDCPASGPLRGSIFGSSLYSRSLVQTLGCGPTVGSPRSSSAPPSLGRGRVVPPPPPQYITTIKRKC